MDQERATKNTDREIWRGNGRAGFGDEDRHYADSLFIPAGDVEALGINCGGFVIVKPIREWHALAFRDRELIEKGVRAGIEYADNLSDEVGSELHASRDYSGWSACDVFGHRLRISNIGPIVDRALGGK